MTVGELIDRLQSFPDNMKVTIWAPLPGGIVSAHRHVTAVDIDPKEATGLKRDVIILAFHNSDID